MNLRGRYRNALILMACGWILGLATDGGFYIYAQRTVKAASQRADAIWSNPKDLDPASLPELDRIALLTFGQSPVSSQGLTSGEVHPGRNKEP